MVTSDWFLLIVSVSTISAISEAVSLSKVRDDKTFEPRHYLNHPPSAEYYNPIPVAIVFDEANDYSIGSKSEIKTVTDKNDKKEIDGNVKEAFTDLKDINQTITEKEISTSTESNTIVGLVAKPRALNDFQIPVAVVYDSDPYIQKSRRTKTDINAEPSRRNSGYVQKQQRIVEDKKKPSEQSAQTSKAEKLQTRIDTRTFQKRTKGRDPVVPIIDMESYVFSHSGNFHYRYEGGDGTKAYSEGKQITVDDEAGESVVGGFSYKDKDGNDFSLTYTADENGYRPVGDHLPTPPPIPPAIARALEYLATATPEPVTQRPHKS